MNITVLYGGDSPEREVSLRSGARVAEALRSLGHNVLLYDYRVGTMSSFQFEEMRRADAVFLALHGGAGENGSLQAHLEKQGIFHYTGTRPAAAARAMNKQDAKSVIEKAGIAVPRGCVLQVGGREKPDFPPPWILKPLSGGSSVGLKYLADGEELFQSPFEEPQLCEEYLSGREYTVGIVGELVLPVVEILPIGGCYDYQHKYLPGASRELCPAPLPADRAEALQKAAQSAFAVLGLRDFARMDFKEDGQGIPRFLEANTLPGMTATSLLPLAAAVAGLPFSKLCTKMVLMAAARKK